MATAASAALAGGSALDVDRKGGVASAGQTEVLNVVLYCGLGSNRPLSTAHMMNSQSCKAVWCCTCQRACTS